jgi:hypothetical protein
MEQVVARWAHNPKVAGSSPVSATNKISASHYTRLTKTLLTPCMKIGSEAPMKIAGRF